MRGMGRPKVTCAHCVEAEATQSRIWRGKITVRVCDECAGQIDSLPAEPPRRAGLSRVMRNRPIGSAG